MLYIHTSNHLEQLKNQYADLVKAPLSKVFKKETVVVQNAGMARWLSIEMAKTTGISANTEYLFPAEYMWRLLRLVSPDIPENSQCAPDTLRFRIYDELSAHPEEYPELHHYILTKNGVDELSTWGLSCETAKLLDQYLFYRSDWVHSWEQKGPSQNAPHSNHWQARIWNTCVKDKGLLHWLRLQEQFSTNIEKSDSSILEERVSFFSMSALSPGYIDLLGAVAQKTDIHIFIINPCADIYWGDIQSPKMHAKLEKIEQEYSEIGNPLLASMGKQGRDFIEKLINIQDQDIAEEIIDSTMFDAKQKLSLLNQIQQDIYDLEQPQELLNFDRTDQSIQIHSCHTVMREVEVLHDQILAQLDADLDLTPSDIVVMMPDIEKYAPYIESVFSHTINPNNQQKLPFSIADRDPQNIFKIIQAINKLLCLPDSRFDVETVLELLEYDDVRQYFGLDQEQFNYCRDLALATDVRWGISAKTRQRDQLPDTEEHTWKYALDRMLLGYPLFENDVNLAAELFTSKRKLNVLPYNDIEGSNALVLAKFKTFTDLVFTMDGWQKQTCTLDKWIEQTIALIKQLCPASPDQERIFKALSDIELQANLANFKQELSYSVYQKLLQQSLSEISASEKYLGYGITFCALVPMRSVPFKIVALMGMNDAEFPRQDTRPSFDLMAKESRRGDRSRRDEDRYLFLESLLAAREKVIISYIGQSIKDNTDMAPSILVSELLDTIKCYSGLDPKDWILKHPLQAFSVRYFETNNIQKQPLFSYAAHYIQAKSESITNNKKPHTDGTFISKPLETLGNEFKTLSLKDLIDFYKNPSRSFLKMRFDITHSVEEKVLKVREPFDIESFKERDIRNLALSESIDGDKEQIARAKGLLPYGQIGESLFAKEMHTVQAFQQQIPDIDYEDDSSFVLTIDEFDLHVRIHKLSKNGRCVKQVSQLFAVDYIDLWITHLCLNIHNKQSNESHWMPVTQFYSPEISFQLNPVEDAQQQLSNLLKHYWKGLHFPLAFFPKSSFSLYAKTGQVNLFEMSSKWNGNDRFAGEKDSFEHSLLHRNLILDQEQQDDEFMQVSHDVFGNMFAVLTNL